MGVSVVQLVRILSASIAPVIVISGVGLLLLSMTNRYGRVIDRARELGRDLNHAAAQQEVTRRQLVVQIEIIYRRARLLRAAIIASSACIVFVALTVLSLFAGQIMQVEVDYVSVPFFGLGLVSLLASLYFFIQDVTISLAAVELEIGSHTRQS
jgi:hypothetical protein